MATAFELLVSGGIGLAGALGATYLQGRFQRQERREKRADESKAVRLQKVEEITALTEVVMRAALQDAYGALEAQADPKSQMPQLSSDQEFLRLQTLTLIYLPEAAKYFDEYDQELLTALEKHTSTINPLTGTTEEEHQTARSSQVTYARERARLTAALVGNIRAYVKRKLPELT